MIRTYYSVIMSDIKFISHHHHKIAYSFFKGTSNLPPIIFLSGFKSNMNGSKAEWLSEYCKNNQQSFLRFDYFAHGQSTGDFMDFTIGQALSDTLFMLDNFIDRPAIIIGSSMGGWIALRLLKICPEKITGFIGIAAAPDFTRNIYAQLDDSHLHDLQTKGYISEESDYAEPYIFTKKLLDEGENHCLLGSNIDFNGRVHLIQGKQDLSVNFHVPDHINKCFDGKAIINLIDDGDHSLSRPQDLEILRQAIKEMIT